MTRNNIQEESTLVLARGMIEEMAHKETTVNDVPYFLVLDASHEQNVIYLPADKIRITIGSDSQNDIVLHALDKEHAVCIQEGSQYVIEKLHEDSAVLVNGVKVDDRKLLQDSDELTFGTVKVQFIDRASTVMRELAALPIFRQELGQTITEKSEVAHQKKPYREAFQPGLIEPNHQINLRSLVGASDAALIAFCAVIVIGLVFGLFLLLEQN